MTQANLFGEPPMDAALSQWHTSAWIARKLAEWIPPTARVLEPAAGRGNLIAALIERGHDPERIVAVELDPAWRDECEARFEGRVKVIGGDFLRMYLGTFDISLMNPPFEEGLHAAFVHHALEHHSPQVAGVFPVSIEFGEERDRTLWAARARVLRRSRLPERVKYGGKWQASFDTVALKVERRADLRLPGELSAVIESVWREGEP